MSEHAPHHRPPRSTGISGVGGNRAVADTLVTLIEQELDEQDYEPGHFLGRRKELLERFGVAPATLSEAIRVLRNRGIIDVRPGPGGGIFFAKQPPLTRLANDLMAIQPNSATLNDCLGITDALDQEVMHDAVTHRTAADIRELRALFLELEAVWGDPELAQPLNWRLHKRMAAISPNVVLRTVYQNLVDFILSRLDSVPDAPGFSSTSTARLEVHRQLVEAIATGDHEAADAATRAHRTVLSRTSTGN